MVQRRKIRGSDYLTASEAARRLGCSHPSLYRAINAGKVKAIRVIGNDSIIYAVKWGEVRGFAPRSYTRAAVGGARVRKA